MLKPLGLETGEASCKFSLKAVVSLWVRKRDTCVYIYIYIYIHKRIHTYTNILRILCIHLNSCLHSEYAERQKSDGVMGLAEEASLASVS